MISSGSPHFWRTSVRVSPSSTSLLPQRNAKAGLLARRIAVPRAILGNFIGRQAWRSIAEPYINDDPRARPLLYMSPQGDPAGSGASGREFAANCMQVELLEAGAVHGQRIRRRTRVDERLGRKRARVFFLEPERRECRRNADRFAQLEDPVDEAGVGRLAQANVGGEPRELLRDRRLVVNQHVGHDNAVGEPVMGIEVRRARMAQAMHRAEALLKRGGA